MIAVVLGAEAVASLRLRAFFAIAAGITAIIFGVLIRHSARLGARRRRIADIASVNEQAAFRAERDWTRIAAQNWNDEADEARSDLGIFGSQSLVQLLPPVSALGRNCLRTWLLEGNTVEEIRRRQEGIRELVTNPSLREELAAYGMRAWVSGERIATFIAWGAARSEPMSPSMTAASFVMPAVTLVLFFLQLFGVIGLPLWLASAAVVAGLSFRLRNRTRTLLRPAAGMAAIASTYAEILALVQDQEFRSPKLSDLQRCLGSRTDRSAGVGFQRLAGVADWSQSSASPMLHAVLQAAFMWDWHVARHLDRWRATYGEAIEQWLNTLGELESLAAFAALADANPDWAFPDVVARHPTQIQARELGHPLLPATSGVRNNISIGPPHTVQIISGSNMSGKSTLLRAVGLNVILAQAGAPVCAASMCCPPVQMYTSIQIHDSLQQGLSYFMAEIRRLKVIIDAAEQSKDAGGLPVFYLVDEILRGTNSEERAVAARIIIQRLLEANAIGMITGHDLGMFEDPRVASRAQHYHFRETIEGSGSSEQIAFDYRLHAGPTTSRNALKLLALVGIAPSE
jgi:MutS domain V